MLAVEHVIAAGVVVGAGVNQDPVAVGAGVAKVDQRQIGQGVPDRPRDRLIFRIEIDDPLPLFREGDADHARAVAGADDVVDVDMVVGVNQLAGHRAVELDPIEGEPAIELLEHIGRVERGIDRDRRHALAGRYVEAAERTPVMAPGRAVEKVDARAELAVAPPRTDGTTIIRTFPRPSVR